MNINANVGLRDRSRITLGGFKGLDTLSAAVDVSAIHATEMKNLISRDGVNHKRFGWKTQFRIRDENGLFLKIQGIFDFTICHERFLIVYAGKKFWRIDALSNNYQDITDSATTIAVIDKTLLDDTECKCYVNGNKAYFIGCGDLLVFSKWGNGLFELRRVVGNEDVHIPTTTENIGSEEDGQHYTRITAEERNLLSPQTKNLLFGRESMEYTDASNYDTATYYLDATGFIDLELSIEHENGTTTAMKRDSSSYAYCTAGSKIKRLAMPSYTKSIEMTGEIKNGVSTLPSTGESGGAVPFATTFPVVGGASGYDVDVALMENGDKLLFNCTEGGNSTLVSKSWTVDGETFTFNPPTQFQATLIYEKSDGNRIALKSMSSCSISVSMISATESSFTYNKNLHFPSMDYDLSEYNAVLSSDYNRTDYGFPIFDFSSFVVRSEDDSAIGEVYPDIGKLVLYPSTKTVEDAGGDSGGDTGGGSSGGTEYYSLFSGFITVTKNARFYAPLTPDTPNITAKMTFTDKSASIISATKGCEFGAQGGTDRLFIVDNTGNTVRWSKDEDFTYFGEKSWCVCGTSDKSITGMDRLNDSTLLIVKEYSPREPSIFIITGNIMTGETEAGTVDYTALFTPHGYQVGMGAVGEIVNFNGDCIMVGKDGLYAVSLGENMTVDSRYVLHRSRQISNKLEKFDLANAKCVSFNGKFFVAVGGEEQECYIADNKYTAAFEGDIQNVVNYEWWRWTNIPVNVWGFVGNELWFGTNDGQLCCFTENFYDEILTCFPAGKGLVYYDCEHNDDGCVCEDIIGFGFVNDIKFRKGDIFTPTCDFYGGVTTNKFECVDGETKFYLPLNDYLDGEKIYIDNTAYTITKHDLYFSIPYTTELTELTIYRNYKNKPLTVMDDVVMALKDSADNFPIWSKVASNGGLNPSIGNFSATLSHKEPVVAKWVSGAMDLGTRAYSKSLTYLVLTGEKDLANRLKYGLKTRFTHRDYELLRANNDLDFTELDLQTVSMDSDFASSYTKKLNIRNINFLMFYFVSDTVEDVALNSIQIEFKLYKRNIGVR